MGLLSFLRSLFRRPPDDLDLALLDQPEQQQARPTPALPDQAGDDLTAWDDSLTDSAWDDSPFDPALDD